MRTIVACSSRPKTALGFLLIASALVLAMPGVLRADVSGTPGVRSSRDGITRERVRAALLADLGADSRGVRIDVHGSRVVLFGTVGRYATKELAEEVALSVPGVRHTDEELRVVEPRSRSMLGRAAWRTEHSVKWAMLQSRVKTRLLAEVGETALHIDVEAAEGEVSLRGVVPTAEHHRLALEAARHTRGVSRVIDLLRQTS